MGAGACGNSLQCIRRRGGDSIPREYDTEDALKVVRDEARKRPCMYTVRREAAKDTEKREIADRRTYAHMRQSAHEWVCEQYRKTARPGSHTAGVEGRLWSEVAVASLKHPWDKK